jgi:hypothetical protein
MNSIKYSLMMIMFLLLAGTAPSFAGDVQAVVITKPLGIACTTPQLFIQFQTDIKNRNDKDLTELENSRKCMLVNDGWVIYIQDDPSPIGDNFIAFRVRNTILTGGATLRLWTLKSHLTGHYKILQ